MPVNRDSGSKRRHLRLVLNVDEECKLRLGAIAHGPCKAKGFVDAVVRHYTSLSILGCIDDEV
jgi:hypothetical protein